MKMMRFAVLLAGVAVLGACKDPLGEDVTLAPEVPLAYTRFVNGLADTGSTDWRFVDALEYSPFEFGMTFRSFSPYAGTRAGARQLKIFPTSTNINVTSAHFIDSTHTFEAGKYYTVIHTGFARTGSTPADQLLIIEDPVPTTTIGATNFATRFIHAGTSLAGQDVYALASTTTAISGTPLFDNVTYGNASTYDVARPACLTFAGPTPPAQSCAMAFRTANDGTTAAIASALAPAGDTAQVVNGLTAIGGYQIARSVVTGILFPRSVAGSAATNFTTPGIVFLVDRHPNP